MPNYPMDFNVALDWTAASGKNVLSAPPRPEIVAGAPPGFGGTDQVWSPEHLLLSSVSLCLMLTFEALAERAKLKIDGYRCQAAGTVDKEAGPAAFSKIKLRVDLRGPDRDRAEPTLQTAKKFCLISNSLKAAVTVEAVPSLG